MGRNGLTSRTKSSLLVPAIRLHVNHYGNLMMGQYISRQLGLPELPVPQDMLHAGQVPAEWLIE